MYPAVRTATPEDITICANVLAEAFQDDPLMSYIWPDAQRRRRALSTYFDASIRHHHIHGGGVQVVTDDGGAIVGVANWDPPGHWKQPLHRTIRASPTLLRALRERIPTALRLRGELEAHHPTHPQWYLANIGTAQHIRGTGFGARLLNARLRACDELRLPAYLVCTRHENIAYYEGFGFGVTGEFNLPDGGPPMWSMWRDPTPGN